MTENVILVRNIRFTSLFKMLLIGNLCFFLPAVTIVQLLAALEVEGFNTRFYFEIDGEQAVNAGTMFLALLAGLFSAFLTFCFHRVRHRALFPSPANAIVP